jgi:putative Mn2+ efflux pump MntP
MNFFTIFGIALGLAMDSFAVSISCGIASKKLQIRNAVKTGLFFGGFQALMPLIGWYIGLNLRQFFQSIDHWIAFGLLGIIGIKMIYESTRMENCEKEKYTFKTHILCFLGIATSIDALAVGLSLAFLNVEIITPVLLIGIVTFALSFIGVCIGCKLGHFFEKGIEAIGGIVLILIGTKILIEHISKGI